MQTESGGRSTKAAGAMLTIGEVSELLGVKPHILRYWEAQFETLQPLKRAGGRRYYRTQDVALLRDIDRLLNREGFTLRGARQHLESQRRGVASESSGTTSATSIVADDKVCSELRRIRAALADALAAA
ncbi:MerR family transcriptional regulator [Blastomonas sp.]|uniref:MerR family transcriptional regulator n=1 Tax=Blastomonas sp. TaxID=1909299 RepID=UPI0035933615